MSIKEDVADYYSKKVIEYGARPRGVDWSSESGQVLRFDQLSKIIDLDNEFSVNDIGCGYGAYLDYLCEKYEHFDYQGVDISNEMISLAEQQHKNLLNASFLCSSNPTRIATYTVSSGIFNVKLGYSDAEWLQYIKQVIKAMNASSSKGFAFNCLTKYSDREKMQGRLFYGDPGLFFDWCKENFSKHVALLHDYDLYEFTILVRK